MNIELIKSELEKLSLLLSAWSSDEPISPIERDVALDYLKHLYDQIRFGEAAAPAVPVMPAVVAAAEVAPQSEMEEQDEAQDEEKDVEVELVTTHKVEYSDVDMNAHANNAMYMQWAMNAVGYEVTESRCVKSWTINFNHEIKPQEDVDIYRACVEAEDGLHVFIEGRLAEQSAFIVDILFS